jgi:putative flippase GtrA
MNPRRSLPQLFRYGMTGGAAAVVDLDVFAYLCPAVLPVAAAAVISFLCAAVVNYALSTAFVFNQEFGGRRFARFLVFATIGLMLNVSVTILLTSLASAPPPVAKTIGIGAAFLLNFWLNSVFVFAARYNFEGSQSVAIYRSTNTK